MMKQLTGAQIVLECLKEQGVDTVFGGTFSPCVITISALNKVILHWNGN